MRNIFNGKRPGLIKDLQAARNKRDDIVLGGLDAKLSKIAIGKFTYEDLQNLEEIRQQSILVARGHRSAVHAAEHKTTVIEGELRKTAPESIGLMRQRISEFVETCRRSWKPMKTETVELRDVYGNDIVETSETLDMVLFQSVTADAGELIKRLEDLELTASSESDCKKALTEISLELNTLESVVWGAPAMPLDADNQPRETKPKRSRVEATEPVDIKVLTI